MQDLAAIRMALHTMGYSEERPGKWAKPIAFQLFTYSEERNEWVCWYKPVDGGDPARMETKKFNADVYGGDYVLQLKTFEQWTKKDVYNTDSHFEIRALEFRMGAIDL